MKDTLCPLCGKSKLREEVSEFRSHFVDDQGVRHDVVVPDALKFRCDSCGEYILDPGIRVKDIGCAETCVGFAECC